MLTATTGALVLNPVDTTVNIETGVTATTGALSLVPVDTAVTADTSVTATTGALSLVPVNTTVTASNPTSVTATTGLLSLVPVNTVVTTGVGADPLGAGDYLQIDYPKKKKKVVVKRTKKEGFAQKEVKENKESAIVSELSKPKTLMAQRLSAAYKAQGKAVIKAEPAVVENNTDEEVFLMMCMLAAA